MPGRHYHTLPNPNDADDERSVSDADDIEYSSNIHALAPSFPGQDVRPTSKKELLGWYSYAWAAEVFVVCGIGSFIPVTLEQLARENGVLLSDESIPCTGSSHGMGHAGEKNNQCVVYILGAKINTASFAMYTFSVSVFLQSLIIISMSGAADHGAYRKRLLLLFAMIGSISTMMFITVSPDFYLFSALWATLGNIGFGASFVLLNAFLPVLVRHHPDLLFIEREAAFEAPIYESTEESALLANTGNCIPKKEENSPELVLSTHISSYGIAIGYTAAVLLQMISIGIVSFTGSTVQSLKLVLFFIGLWWFSFSMPAALCLRPRPGPPLPKLYTLDLNGDPTRITRDRSWWSYIEYSWVGLYKTFLRARQLKDVMLFLAAWFLISDGIATVSGTAVLFAKTNLHMKPGPLAMISVVSTVMGVCGAFSWPKISKLLNTTPSQTILICVCVLLVIPIYGLLGFIPSIQRSGFGGLTSPWEMYGLGAIYGFVLGGVSGYCRSVFGELIPPGSEAAFYALYAVTDKGSSIFGPAIVGLLTDRYGDIRVSFYFLAILLVAPIPLIYFLDVSRGRREGLALASEEMKLAGQSSSLRDEDIERL